MKKELFASFVILYFLSLVTACTCTNMSQLRIGMTEDEALKIMGRGPSKVGAEINAKYLYFSCRGAMNTSGIKFVDGRLVAYGEEDFLNKTIWWFKLCVTEADFKRDISECTQQSTGPFGHPFKECMEARGYKQE